MNYTLICYKPATYDHCSGITESEHEIYCSTKEASIIDSLAECLAADHFQEMDEADWETTLLIDGVEAQNDYFVDLLSKAHSVKREKIATQLEATKRFNQDIKRKQAEKQKQDELDELQRLTTKYG